VEHGRSFDLPSREPERAIDFGRAKRVREAREQNKVRARAWCPRRNEILAPTNGAMQ